MNFGVGAHFVARFQNHLHRKMAVDDLLDMP